jgi:2-C-methyl-D-erythritol 4-phosphate cytidylyltransferase
MVQTPQKYITEKLFKSHNVAISQGIKNCTDDLDLMKKIGLYWNYKYIEGPYENIKITYPLDLQVAEAICNWRIENK